MKANYFSIPCNCHAFFSCNVMDATAELKLCPHWCFPRSLVFDPNTQACVRFDLAPPGTCYDTPSTPDPTNPTTEYVPTTTPFVPTTEEETTTPEPTTTTTTAAPTTTTTTAAPTTTPDASADC